MSEHNSGEKSILGFWVYLMTDLVMFAALFATFAVLRGNTFGGPGGKELFSLPFVLVETIILLTSSFTCGLAILGVNSKNLKQVYGWFGATFVLGLAFLIMEMYEFSHLVAEGYSWQSNAFLSSFFTLVGTHGLHILVGLFWIIVGLYMVYKRGLSEVIANKLVRLSLFWHFLDVVWIFIFTVVYLYAHI